MIFKKQQPKIFCISIQRTGTTSVGQFFKDHNYKVAGYERKRSTEWSRMWFIGNFEAIFKSKDFKNHQVFEDNPWWSPGFYKVLFHRFPNAKFILFTRDPDKWFDSMVSHSNGKTLGNTYRHSRIYRRETEFDKLYPFSHDFNSKKIDNLLELNESHREHYKAIYETWNRDAKLFFEQFGSERIIKLELEDPLKWQKLGTFFNLDVKDGFEVHANKSKKS
ncbi:sulfotransferase [uncultured Planktosalinus sp.]|mgnify:CR=1 FL=1|uniref:sulfotransferase n=1 Tax=uncultured Planktosalinus sp. TaxID=1810935 RepID=UPI0030D95673